MRTVSAGYPAGDPVYFREITLQGSELHSRFHALCHLSITWLKGSPGGRVLGGLVCAPNFQGKTGI